MKYLVMSDSHGDRDIVQKIYDQFKGQVDVFLHCGDSELPAEDLLWESIVVIQGNCDYDTGYKKEQLVRTKNDRIYLTHGHLYQVNFTMTPLELRAKEEKATIALFGHTHKLGCEYIDGTLYVNPGSISQPRGLPYESFAIIDSNDDTFDVSYYDRSAQKIPDLTFSFKKKVNN